MKIYQRVVHSIIGAYPNEKYQRVVKHFIGVCQTNLHDDKQKPFILEKKFHTWKNACVRESVRNRGMGHGMGHSCRNPVYFT